MTTKITKWTRERGGRKDFVDATRQSHQKLKVHLNGQEVDQMRELARYEKKKADENYQEMGERLEAREDAVIRRRIEQLRAQLHDVTVEEVKKW